MKNSTHQVTFEDVENALLSSPHIKIGTRSIESWAPELFEVLDHGAIKKAALYGDELNSKTYYANAEISRQLVDHFRRLEANGGRVARAGSAMNSLQQFVVDHYASGEFKHVTTMEEARDVGDTLFIFVLLEARDAAEGQSDMEAVEDFRKMLLSAAGQLHDFERAVSEKFVASALASSSEKPLVAVKQPKSSAPHDPSP